MKIITWNCNMAFRNKAEYIYKEQADILIVPECENLDKLVFKNKEFEPTHKYWFGENQNKGLGIFSYTDFKIKPLPIFNPEYKYVVPLSISNKNIRLTVFAIWAQKPEKHDGYVQHIWNAVHYYNKILIRKNVIIVGDFNSNSIWDKPNRGYNHTTLVDLLKKKKIESTYHSFQNEVQGEETIPTFFLHRNIDKPYHLDFCFASKNILSNLESVDIGNHQEWTKLSDHVPFTVLFNL